MGGHAAGEVASRARARHAAHLGHRAHARVRSSRPSRWRTPGVFEMSHTDNAMRGMGTTLCAVALVMTTTTTSARRRQRRRLAGLPAAGRRARAGHRGPQPRRELVRQGRSPERGAVHPQRNILTRALGIDARRRGRLVGGRRRSRATATCCAATACSTRSSDDRIAGVAAPTSPTRTRPRASWSRLANEGGGRDNITVVIVDVVGRRDRVSGPRRRQNVGLEPTSSDRRRSRRSATDRRHVAAIRRRAAGPLADRRHRRRARARRLTRRRRRDSELVAARRAAHPHLAHRLFRSCCSRSSASPSSRWYVPRHATTSASTATP